MLPLNPSLSEFTTAATDAAMGVLSLLLRLDLRRLRVRSAWQRNVWSEVFGLLVAGSVLGAITHGFELSAAVRAQIWLPLYLSLGLAVALFVVGAVGDLMGEAAGRRLFPWALAAGVGFFAASQWLDGAFLYEGAAMLLALAIYVRVAMRGEAWAWWTAWGIALTLGAATVLIAAGVRAGLRAPQG